MNLTPRHVDEFLAQKKPGGRPERIDYGCARDYLNGFIAQAGPTPDLADIKTFAARYPSRQMRLKALTHIAKFIRWAFVQQIIPADWSKSYRLGRRPRNRPAANNANHIALIGLIDEYQRHLTVERNLAERTRLAYQFDLHKFSDWLAVHHQPYPSIDEIKVSTLREFLGFMHDSGWGPHALGRITSTLKVFFSWAVGRELICGSPAVPLVTPKLPLKLPIYLTKAELCALMGIIPRNKPAGARDFAIMLTLAFAGLRVAELISLQISQVDVINRTIKVFGKGRKERVVPMNKELHAALVEYLPRRPNIKSDSLFLNRFKRAMTARGVEKILNEYAKAAGIQKRISPHKLRHTFASLMYQSGVDLNQIKQLLGHASIASTQIYTHTSVEQLRDSVAALDLTG